MEQIEYFWLLDMRKTKKKKPDIHAKSFKEIGKIWGGRCVCHVAENMLS